MHFKLACTCYPCPLLALAVPTPTPGSDPPRSPPGVEALARGCPKLSHFIAKGCDQINDAAVVQLARHCPGLEVVSLERCDVSDAA